MAAILGREDRLRGVEAPVDAKRRIVEGEPRVVGGRIEIRHFVEDLSVGLQGDEAVSEALWHEHLAPIAARQFRPHVSTEGLRTAPQIDSYIQDRAPDDPHEFVLRERRSLKMQSTDRPGFN